MKPTRLVFALRFALGVAIFASAALVIDYMNPGDPAFCGVASACMKVRRSEVGVELARFVQRVVPGASLPQVALLGFVALFVATLFLKSRRAIVGLAGPTIVAGLAGAGLIAAQLRVGALCAYCMAVDVSAIVAAIAAIALVRATRTHEAVDEAARASDGDVTIGWGFAAAALSVLPFVWASFPEIPPLPASLAALQSPGKLTIVSFTDFECPYCRLLHPVVEEAKKRPDVVLQRFMVPLDGHLGALPAAQGYLCVPAEKQDEMAHALYAAEPKGMMPNAVVDLGVSLGMERSALIACMTSPATAATIAEHKRLFFDELAGQGLPTTYVGDRMIKGAQVDKLRALIAHGPKPALVLPVWALFVSAIGVLVAAVSYGIRLTERPRPSDPTPAEG